MPSSSAIANSTGVRGSPSLWIGWPRPGTTRLPARTPAQRLACDVVVLLVGDRRRAALGDVGGESLGEEPAAVLGDAEVARAAAEQAAAIAPCTDSGAPVSVSRAAMTVGVRPWSASATSTVSNTRASPAVGRRCATSQNASSAKPTLPMRSAARSWPRSVIEARSDVPIDVG